MEDRRSAKNGVIDQPGAVTARRQICRISFFLRFHAFRVGTPASGSSTAAEPLFEGKRTTEVACRHWIFLRAADGMKQAVLTVQERRSFGGSLGTID